MTFAFGLASVGFVNWSVNYWTEISVDLPQVNSSSVIEITTKRTGRRFESIGFGCGGTNEYGGSTWVQGFQSDNWQGLSRSGSSHNSSKETRREIEQRIKDADHIIESDFVLNETTKRREHRIILANKINDEKWIDILKYDGGKSIKIISAHSLPIALEFEKYWEKAENALK